MSRPKSEIRNHRVAGRLTALVFVIAVALVGPAYAADESSKDIERSQEKDSIPVSHTDEVSLAGKPLAIDAGGIFIQFGGFVKLDAMQDFDPIGNPDQFKVNSIPVPPDPDAELGGSTNFIARSTRFTVDLRNRKTVDQKLRAYVEGDFFGSGNSFRLRHAYGEWNGILGGQTWSTFQDISARPFTLDYEGPDAEIFVRQAMLRYTHKASDGLQWSIALEDPDSQIDDSIGGAGSGRSELPDIAGNLRFSNDSGHIQVAGLLRQIRYAGSDIDEKATGYGINVTGATKVFGSGGIMGQIALGSGLGRYIETFGGTNSDAVLTSNGSLETLDGLAMVAGYNHRWTEKWSANLSVAYAELDNEPDQSDDAMHASTSMHLNVIYTPIEPVVTGVELMWGERENNDGSTGDAVRLQFSLQYRFR